MKSNFVTFKTGGNAMMDVAVVTVMVKDWDGVDGTQSRYTA